MAEEVAKAEVKEAAVKEHSPKVEATTAKEQKVSEVKVAPEARKDFAPREREYGRFGGRRDFDKDRHQTSEFKMPVFTKKRSPFAEYKMFGRWSVADVIVADLSLIKYINLDPMLVPHSFGRKSQGRFAKANINLVERLINKMMRSGQGKRKLSGKFIRGRGGCGKKMQAMQIVEKGFEIVEKQTKQNPIQVLVKAIENSAPREDVTRIKKGGVAYSLSVDVSPMKRLDESLKNIALAAFGGSFNKKVSAEQALADEIIAAANNDAKSIAIKRKDEVERIAKASR